MRPRFSFIDFLTKANKIHNNKYDYSLVKYETMHIKITIICPIHGEFSKSPAKHLKGQGCKKCSQGSTEKFIEKATIIHKNFYDYSLVDYKGANSKVKITCPIHGIFEQNPSKHINSECGCYKCNKFGLNKKTWISKINKNDTALLYILKCYNENEIFVKIGITSKSFEKRYLSKYSLPYNYEIISLIQDTPEKIWDLEYSIKTNNLVYSYKPKFKFGGWTECFTTEILNIFDL